MEFRGPSSDSTTGASKCRIWLIELDVWWLVNSNLHTISWKDSTGLLNRSIPTESGWRSYKLCSNRRGGQFWAVPWGRPVVVSLRGTLFVETIPSNDWSFFYISLKFIVGSPIQFADCNVLRWIKKAIEKVYLLSANQKTYKFNGS